MRADTPMHHLPRVVVLIPAYHAGRRLIDVYNRIPTAYREHVIIVDDASRDDTFARAKTLPVPAYRNEKNLGYGGNLKVCLTKGLATDGDVFVELHGDGQYDPSAIPDAIKVLRPTDGMILGSRLTRRGEALQLGMPLHKYMTNIVLNRIANLVLGTRISEFQTGFRVYTRRFLETANFTANSNDHLFSLETILQALYHGFTVSEIPVACIYEPGVGKMGIRKGIKYVREMLWTLVRYRLAHAGRRDPVFQAVA